MRGERYGNSTSRVTFCQIKNQALPSNYSGAPPRQQKIEANALWGLTLSWNSLTLRRKGRTSLLDIKKR